MIKKTLKHIEEQTGIKLDTCDYFGGLQVLNGNKYFNVVLDKKISASKKHQILLRFANKYKTIRIEQNGLKRIAIFPVLI